MKEKKQKKNIKVGFATEMFSNKKKIVCIAFSFVINSMFE